MTKSYLPKHATPVSPYITVKNVDKAANFYHKAFGFEILELARDEKNVPVHGELKYKSQLIMLGKEGAYEGKTLSPMTSKVASPMNLYIYCEDVDTFYQLAVKAGAKSLTAPDDMFWGDRMCALQCPDEYTWCFATHGGN